jgi:hypothetical protein
MGICTEWLFGYTQLYSRRLPNGNLHRMTIWFDSTLLPPLTKWEFAHNDYLVRLNSTPAVYQMGICTEWLFGSTQLYSRRWPNENLHRMTIWFDSTLLPPLTKWEFAHNDYLVRLNSTPAVDQMRICTQWLLGYTQVYTYTVCTTSLIHDCQLMSMSRLIVLDVNSVHTKYEW